MSSPNSTTSLPPAAFTLNAFNSHSLIGSTRIIADQILSTSQSASGGLDFSFHPPTKVQHYDYKMQSSGGWTKSLTSAPQQGDNASLGTDGPSLISDNLESNETSYPKLDATRKMTLPVGNDQLPLENPLPSRPAVVDLVEEQSLHDRISSSAAEPGRPHVDSASPQVNQAERTGVGQNEHASRPYDLQRAKMVYDIPTLLKLREAQSAVPVMLRVKPEAIAENIFQYMGASTSRRPPPRTRGLSDISNMSTGNAQSHNHTTYQVPKPKAMTQPFRQPHAPPETSILQRHDGFVRFLKQHASPPHHRVTAGGRIVPAGPSSPPPMLDFGSLNGLLRDRPAMAKSSQKEIRSNQSGTRAQKSQATSSMTLGDYLQSQSGSADATGVQHATQPSAVQTAIPLNNVLFGYQPLVAPALQTHASLVPLAMFPDGSTLVSCNGMNYRASWNGTSTSIEPLQPLQLPIDQQYYPQAYQQGYFNNIEYGVAPQPSQVSVPSAPLASSTNVPRPGNPKPDLSFRNEAQNSDELNLKTKLTALDEHLALHHYDITPAERASLIAQRVYLVAEIDKIRLSRDKPKHKIPIVAPAAPGPPITPAAQLNSDSQSNQVSKGGSMSKHLSPAAPAFVPRNSLNPSSTSFGMRNTSQQPNHKQIGMPTQYLEVGKTKQAEENASSSTWTSNYDLKAPLLDNERQWHNGPSLSSGVLDSSDPAMRVIEYEDIEYAARYLYNWTKDTKIYCTTVAEFQEAIRRVREQARLYGCAGGQSKDPAYDAEQDLWWAICDRDPIPLPSEVPDHVTNPRPWNWNDSAFNYRSQGSHDASGSGCEQARNSPRLLGWDPATTDKMKDVVDVSRSYFALKGRLPSVSFRDYAFDREGNKRLIQSDTAASSAYASKETKHLEKSPVACSQLNSIWSSSGSGAPKGMSISQLNSQRAGAASNAQSKPADKEKTQEAISSSPAVPRTPEKAHIKQSFEATDVQSTVYSSKPKVSSGYRITKAMNAELDKDPYHAYVEDHPETPVVGGIRSASKGALTTLIETTPSKLCMGLHSTSSTMGDTRSPVQAKILDSADLSYPGWNPTDKEFNSIWYQTPLDEVTQKYLDDMKAYNPLKNRNIDAKNHRHDFAKDYHQVSDSSRPVTESKSPWGPEEGSTPTPRSGRHRFDQPEMHRSADKPALVRTAKVKIPDASPLKAPVPRVNGNTHFTTSFNTQSSLNSQEFESVSVPTVESNESHNFLRKMLKSPRYSSAQPTSIFSQISSSLAEKINGTKRAHAISSAPLFGNKKDPLSHKNGDTDLTNSSPYLNSLPSASASLARMIPNLTVSKAQSSLASSTYQAHAHLPQFDGAGKAHTSNLYREQRIRPAPQVRLPSEASYSDRQHVDEALYDRIHGPSAQTASTTYHTPVNFGYDGGRDSPPLNTAVNAKDQHSKRLTFDYMGVTPADYENQRGDPNNAWHHGAVEDFFQDLRVQELETISSHQRINPKGAA